MISKRGLVAAGALGLGGVLLAGTSAYACVIGDFSADSAVVCDTSGSQAQGMLTVHNDDTLTGATVTVFEAGKQVGQGHIDAAPPRGQKSSITIAVPWQSGASYTVHIHSDKYNLDKDVPTTPQASDAQCAKAVVPPSAKPSTPVATPSTTPTTKASATPTTKAVAAPAPAQSTPGTKLAETGGGSDSGTMIGIAAALVVVGGGALFMVRRKAGARG